MWYDFVGLLKKYPLGIRVVVWLILFSALIATVSSAIQSWLDYEDEKQMLEQRLDNAAEVFKPALRRSLWYVNEDNTRDLLTGILNLPDVYNVILIGGDQNILTVGDEPVGQPSLSRVYAIYYAGEEHNWLGDLTLIATLAPTRQLVINRFFSTLVEQLFKTSLVAVFLFVVFRYLVSRHLERMSRYARELDLDSPVSALTLDRREPLMGDELSLVVSAINNMRVRVLEQSAELRESERQANIARLEAIRENQHKSQLIASISREFELPMNDIARYSDLLLDKTLSSEQREYLTVVQKRAHSLLSLLNDMLDLARIESGALESQSAPLEIRRLLQEAKDSSSGLASEKRIQIETYLNADLPTRIVADYHILLRILQCLLNVAINLLPRGHIAVHVQPVASFGRKVILRFSVEDHGQGLAVTELAKVLVKNSERTITTSHPDAGIGLKLAVAKELIDSLGGQFGFESEPTEGITLWFETNAELRLPEFKNSERTDLLPSYKLLIADSSKADIQNILRLFSEEKLLQIEIARSVAEAIAMLKKASGDMQFFDAFILDDCIDQGVSGEASLFAVLKAISRDPEHRQKPVIVLSGKPRYENMKKVHQLGASAYLSKFDPNLDLKGVLSTLLTEDKENPAFILSDGVMQAKLRKTNKNRILSVLLVEDNVATRSLARKMLEKIGCRIVEAENGQQAMALLEGELFDIIFMDCWMPVLDGYEATKRIRASKQKNSKTPIIALTANTFVGEKEKCLQIGMNRFLTKPVKFDDLKEIVRQVKDGSILDSDKSNVVPG